MAPRPSRPKRVAHTVPGRGLVHVEGTHYVKKGNRWVAATPAQITARQPHGTYQIPQNRANVLPRHGGRAYAHDSARNMFVPVGAGARRGRGGAAPRGLARGMPVFQTPDKELGFKGGETRVHSLGGGGYTAYGFKKKPGEAGTYVMEEENPRVRLVRRSKLR